MSVVRAAVIQMDSGSNRKENLSKIETYIEKAVHMGAAFVILPETADYIGPDFTRNSWRIEEAEEFYGSLAEKYKIYLHCGSITEQTDQKPRNTTLFFEPSGACLGHYSKLHMFDIQVENGPFYKESDAIQSGNRIAVAKTSIGTFGFAICYDIRFGEMFRLMAQNGARVFCICADFTWNTGKAHWETLLRTRAIENTCYILASNQTGKKHAYTAFGHSMIIDPWGNIMKRCREGEQIITAELDMDDVNQIRQQLPSLKNIRQDIYQLSGSVEIWQ